MFIQTVYIFILTCVDIFLYLYRQYFENSRLETAFIGYSSEMTALTVRQATDDTAKDRDDDDYWDFTVCLYSHTLPVLLTLSHSVIYKYL